jgi:hypothetical protein
MDLTITYDEVTTLVRNNISLLEPRLNFVHIRALCRHFERALQRLPCPQSTLHGWNSLIMACELYALLVGAVNPFQLPVNPGPNAIYNRPILAGQRPDLTPLTRREQATINTLFKFQKSYFLSMQNIKHACFTALNASINDASKLSNNPSIRGWHGGMRVQDILNQLSSIYGQPTPAVLEINNATFCRGQYLAANTPEVLFWRIKDCAKVALLGQNPYTDWQLINNAIHVLLTTGLYVRPFEEWDRMAPATQTWVTLCMLIQEVFQCCLNATVPTAGHHGYAPALPFQQNAFGTLVANDKDHDEELFVEGMANQVAALTYQSQLTAPTAATTNHRNAQQLASIEANQQATHGTLHQIIAQLNAVTFNARNAGGGQFEGRG